ncbi:MAG: response regulator transcription factor, partial [Spirochaetales bacterium]|nr:response regulator transcription factor [Spirochaetales bacterium]
NNLSDREMEVLEYVIRGLTNRETGEKLFISQHTAATHVQHILRKTGMANRTELIMYALRSGMIE